MPLTDTKLRNLKAKEKSYKVSDSGGLYVEVTPTGSRLWRLKYRFEGREKRLSLHHGQDQLFAAYAFVFYRPHEGFQGSSAAG